MSLTVEVGPHVMRHSHMNPSELVEFMLTGGIVVYGTLSLLAILGVMGGYIFVALEKRYGNVDDPESRRLERERKAEELAEQTRLMVIISAAVTEAIGEKHRVINFKPVGETNWSLQGRTQHHSSHKLR